MRRKPRRDYFAPEPAHDPQADAAAHAALDAALSQWPEVRATTSDLRRLRQRNHFAETMNDALKGHRR